MAARDYIVQNFWWKLLSLLLAGLTWLTISIEFRKSERQEESLQRSPVVTSSSRSFPGVAIAVLASPANTNRFKTMPETVAIEVGGTTNDLLRLQGRDIQAFVDVTGAGDEKQFRRPIQVQLPKDFTILSLSPSNAAVARITGPIQ